MDMAKHPIVISLVFGVIAFCATSYVNPVDESKKKKKNLPFYRDKPKEFNVAVSVIVALIVWYIVKGNENTTNQPGEKKNVINSVSEATDASYNLLGVGIKIPTKELPPVMIDYK